MLSDPQPSREAVDTYGLRALRFLGGGHHQNWLCARGDLSVVLRRYVRPPLGDISYEHAVAARLDAEGWPVPVLVEAPIVADGSTWALFRWLRGAPRDTAETLEERGARGRLLAELHETTSRLVDLGQRPGCGEAHDVVADPRLNAALSAYAAWFPREAHVMAWHLERTRTCFAQLDLAAAPRVVLHGDFTPWNLLYDSDVLTGVLDLEATHINFRVADFAGAWRGEADELVYAYDSERPLDELEWSLLTPVYWSWLFLGVADQIHEMIDREAEPRLLRWPVGQLVQRTPLMANCNSRIPAEHTPDTSTVVRAAAPRRAALDGRRRRPSRGAPARECSVADLPAPVIAYANLVLEGTHRALLTLTGGRFPHRIGRMQLLELHTIGRKTGQRRATLLSTPVHDERRVVLVASKGGYPDHPVWYKNLVANPDVDITIEGTTRRMRARTASAEEKAQLWPEIVRVNRGYDGYQQRTQRDIPVVICEPIAD